MTRRELEQEATTGGSRAASVVDLRGAPVIVLDDQAVTEGLSDLRWHLRDLVLGGAQTIEVDLSGTSRMGSSALAALLSAHRACRARGGGVVLVNPNRHVTDVMRRTGLWRVFRVEWSERGSTVQEAVS
jgi:anti-sigma B factor antagonist